MPFLSRVAFYGLQSGDFLLLSLSFKAHRTGDSRKSTRLLFFLLLLPPFPSSFFIGPVAWKNCARIAHQTRTRAGPDSLPIFGADRVVVVSFPSVNFSIFINSLSVTGYCKAKIVFELQPFLNSKFDLSCAKESSKFRSLIDPVFLV